MDIQEQGTHTFSSEATPRKARRKFVGSPFSTERQSVGVKALADQYKRPKTLGPVVIA